MNRLRIAALLTLALAGCGGGESTEVDASVAIDVALLPPDSTPPDVTDIDADERPPAALEFSEPLHDFTDVNAGQSRVAMVELTNTGGKPATGVTLQVTGSSDFTVNGSSCATLMAGASCTVTVVFAPPSGVSGSRTASVEAAAPDTSKGTLLLLGNARPPEARLTLSGDQNFGSVTIGMASSPFTVRVTNAGTAQTGPLTFSSSDGQFELLTGGGTDCTVSRQLDPSEACDIRVVFRPSAPPGAKSAVLSVSASPGGSLTAALRGMAVDPTAAALAMTPTGNQSFGALTVGTSSAPISFTVTNSGGSTSSAISVSITGDNAARFTIGSNSCAGATLATGAMCTFQVTVTPTLAGPLGGANPPMLTVAATAGGTLTALLSATGQAALTANVSATGGAAGTVSSTPMGINSCAASCTATFTQGSVMLVATPNAASGFVAWSGACSGTDRLACMVTMDAARTVTASFVPKRRISVAITSGTGTVASDAAHPGIGCPGDCSEDYNEGTQVTLQATPAAGYRVGSWSQAGCSGASCVVTADMAKTVNVSFVQTFTLTVNATNLGVGTGVVNITPNPGSPTTCTGMTCALVYDTGTTVLLGSAYDPAQTTFQGWAGDCSGSGSCGPLQMTQNRTVTATFSAYQLGIGVTGSGTVDIMPAPASGGATCAPNCTPRFPGGTPVTLTPMPSPGSAFFAWSGDCSGTGNCNLVMSALRSAQAEFRTAMTLTVNKTGAGSVSSGDGQIDCTGACTSDSGQYAQGRTVTLTATAGGGQVLSAWSGACAGATGNSCTVTMDAARTVGVTFAAGLDLSVSAFSCSPDPVGSTATLNCSLTVQNSGSLAAGSFNNQVVLSSDTTIGAGDTQIATCTVAAIAAGSTGTATCMGAVPASLASGLWHAGLTIDYVSGNPNGAVAESLEGNNTAFDPVTVVRPDLRVTAFTCSPNPVRAGADATCNLTVENAGQWPSAATFTNQIVLSADTIIDASDGPVGTCTLGALAAGASASVTCDAVVPQSLVRAGWQLGVRVDSGGAVDEESESNNSASAAVQVGLAAPDLVVSALTCAPDPVANSAVIACNATVENRGLVAAGSFDVRVWTGATTIGRCPVAGLAPGASLVVACGGDTPSVGNGVAFTVTAEADFGNGIGESYENNNGKSETVFTRLGIVNQDLVVQAMSCAQTVLDIGQSTTCTISMGNIGGEAAGAFELRLYSSADTLITVTDELLAVCNAGGIAAHSEASVTCDATIPIAATRGARNLGIILNTSGAVSEQNANNNTASLPFHVATVGSNLVPRSITCSDTVLRGGFTGCEITVENRGDAAAAASSVTLRLSTDGGITSGDALVATCPVGAVAPTASATFLCGGVVPAGTGGAMFLGALAPNASASATAVLVSGAAVDLVVTGVSCSTPMGPGNNDCSVAITNRGSAPAGAFQFQLWLSTDSTIPTGDTFLNTCTAAGGVDNGASQSVACSGTIPGGTSGVRYLGVVLDSATAIPESSEGNNVGFRNEDIFSDLVVTAATCTPTLIARGGGPTCAITLRNAGGLAIGAFRLDVYQSTDAVTIYADPVDPVVGGVNVPGLAGNQTLVVNVPTTLGSDGTFFLNVVADALQVIVERDDNNNIFSSGQVTVGLGNLTAGAVTGCNPNPVTRGSGTLQCNIAIQNTTGNWITQGFSTRFFFSSNTTITTGTDPMWFDCQVTGGIAAGTTRTVSCSALVPAGAPLGMQYVGAAVDLPAGVAETDETTADQITSTTEVQLITIQ